MLNIKKYTDLMIKELAEYSILKAFRKDDDFAEFTVKEVSNTSWGVDFGFSEDMRHELFEEILFEEDTSGFMCYKGSPFIVRVDSVFFLDKLIAIDFVILGTKKFKMVINMNESTFNLILNDDEILTNEPIDKSKLYKSRF